MPFLRTLRDQGGIWWQRLLTYRSSVLKWGALRTWPVEEGRAGWCQRNGRCGGEKGEECGAWKAHEFMLIALHEEAWLSTISVPSLERGKSSYSGRRPSSPLDLTLFIQSLYTLRGSEIPLGLTRLSTGRLRSQNLTWTLNGSLLSL